MLTKHDELLLFSSPCKLGGIVLGHEEQTDDSATLHHCVPGGEG